MRRICRNRIQNHLAQRHNRNAHGEGQVTVLEEDAERRKDVSSSQIRPTKPQTDTEEWFLKASELILKPNR